MTFDTSMIDFFIIIIFYSGTCFEAFHLYQKRNKLKNGETGKAAIAILRYGKPSCKSRTVCGPNYCCCRA